MQPSAVVFDFYGTLFRLDAVTDALRAYTAQADQVAAAWRKRQLQFAFASASTRRWRDFDGITLDALREAAERYFLKLGPADIVKLMNAWRLVEPYDDVRPTLTTLREEGHRLAVLSNGTPASLEGPLERHGLRSLFDTILSASAVETYKPNGLVYELATLHYAVPPREIAFVSSNDWDAQGASQYGFASIWCDRATRRDRRPERVIDNLLELSKTLESI
jgi:2-haloacid dehalogenase